MVKIKFVLLVISMVACSMTAGMAWPPKSWTQNVEPFQITGTVYYVGSLELASYLVVDHEGLVLVNVGLPENTALVINNVAKLGFDPAKIQYILLTQSHLDHAGGVNAMLTETDATVVVGYRDRQLLISGGTDDHLFGNDLQFPPVSESAVKTVQGGDVIRLGKLRFEALATPGHTPGSTSWLLYTTNNQSQVPEVLFQASLSLLYPERLHNNQLYPSVIEDFRMSVAQLNDIVANYYLPDHSQFAKPDKAELKALNAEWFKDRTVLNRQLVKTQKKLVNLK